MDENNRQRGYYSEYIAPDTSAVVQVCYFHLRQT